MNLNTLGLWPIRLPLAISATRKRAAAVGEQPARAADRSLKGAARHGLLLLVLALLAPAPAPADDAPGEPIFERWYVLRLEGDRIGYAHITARRDEARITTTNRTHVSLRRGPVSMVVEEVTRFIETHDGTPIEAHSRSTFGQMAMERTMRFEDDDEVELTTRQAGREQTRRLPAAEEDWLPPAAAQRYIEHRFEQGAERIELRTLDPSLGHEPFTVTMNVLGEEQVEVLGKVVPAIVWEAQISAMPGVTAREYVDRSGRTVRTTMSLGPGMEIEMIQADRELATAEVDPPELLAAMFVEPSVAIEAPRQLRHAVYELTLDEALEPARFQPPQTGYQRVVWGDERTARVIVSLDSPVTAGEDLPTDAHREASAMLDHTDPRVRELVDRALGDDGDALDDAQIAERMRRFVYEFVTEKDLSVGLGTASEVARTAQGDCTEHAVLLAAMLRAVDIPSRTATGLVYVDRFLDHEGVFGGHMWTQAWLPAIEGGGRTWIDLDPTLDDRATDAARITLAVSAMSDAGGNDLVGMVPVLGGLDIRVINAKAGE